MSKTIDYIAKDYDSIVDALVSYANVHFGPGTTANRKWTNFNLDSFSRNWLEIVAYTTDLIFFYLDNQATQAYLQTATLRSAVYDIARQFGFEPASATSSSGNVIFTLRNSTSTGTSTIIPRGFRLTDAAGQEYYLTTAINATIPANSTVTYTGTVLQGIVKTENFSAVGVQNEEILLTGPTVVKDTTNSNTLDISPTVTVNGNTYLLVTSFLRFNGLDSDPVIDSLGNVIGGGGRVYTLSEKANGKPYIKFGDGIFGRKLNPNDTVTVIYRTGGGSLGNLSSGSSITPKDTNIYLVSTTISGDFSGGADQQSIEQLRSLIPASLRTLDRAVAQQDYSDILKANFTEVFTASTEINFEDPGIDINIYVVPNGVGIPQISDNPILKTKLSNYLDRRKMVTVQYQIRDAFGIDILISLEVYITNTASKSTVRTAINTALTNYFDLVTGGSDGNGIQFAEPILLKNIISIIQTVPGIERFEVKRLTYRPRVVKNVVGLSSEYAITEVELYNNVEKLEWLVGASGTKYEATGTIFSNTSHIGFTYTSGTGELIYDNIVDLSLVSPGDLFMDGTGVNTFEIQGVDPDTNRLFLFKSLTIDTTHTADSHGSILNAATPYQSYTVFKKYAGVATNLSNNSITDSSLDFTVYSGTGIALSARILLDNTKVYLPNTLNTGDYFLLDSNSNLWEIVANDSNTIKTGLISVNDASVSSVAAGAYRIVKRFTGDQILFQTNRFTILYNTHNTFYSIGALFNQIGTLGDKFQINETQLNVGNLGVDVDLITFDNVSKTIRLNGSPNLEGINSSFNLIDNTGQIFNLNGADNRSVTSVSFDSLVGPNSKSYVLKPSSLGSQYGQGFKVTTTETYTVVSLYCRKLGNIIGSLTAKLVNDSGGLPDLTSVVAISEAVNINTITTEQAFSVGLSPLVITDGRIDTTSAGILPGEVGFVQVNFTFVTPPTLTAATQYHLVVLPDLSYSSNYNFSTTPVISISPSDFSSYSSSSGVVTFGTGVDLSSVVEGNYFYVDGNYYIIENVTVSPSTITIASGLSISSPTDLAIYRYDGITLGVAVDPDATYADGAFSRFDGVSTWALPTDDTDGFFTVEGPKNIKIDSNLTPVLGAGATISKRYYDDNNQISFILGFAGGVITSATDVTPYGKGTVGTSSDSKVDNFVFRTSNYVGDIINLRLNEIPTITTDDISMNIYNGVD